MVNHFWQRVDAILEEVSVTETTLWCTSNSKTIIFQCSKNYVSQTRVIRLKVAPNMPDPISFLTKRDRSLKRQYVKKKKNLKRTLENIVQFSFLMNFIYHINYDFDRAQIFKCNKTNSKNCSESEKATERTKEQTNKQTPPHTPTHTHKPHTNKYTHIYLWLLHKMWRRLINIQTATSKVLLSMHHLTVANRTED